MVTITNLTKNSITTTNLSKNLESVVNTVKSHYAYFFITTDVPDYVLVGSSEDEYLVWDTPTLFTNLLKS